MQFTGRNLKLVLQGLEEACSWLRNEIATCPDVFAYADDIADLERQIAEREKLIARVERAVAEEDRWKGQRHDSRASGGTSADHQSLL